MDSDLVLLKVNSLFVEVPLSQIANKAPGVEIGLYFLRKPGGGVKSLMLFELPLA